MGDLSLKLRILRYMVSNTITEWRDTVWRRDLDERYCCDGRECGCMGSSIREVWTWETRK